MFYFDNEDSNDFLSTKYPSRLSVDGYVYNNLAEFIEEMKAKAEDRGNNIDLAELLVNGEITKFIQNPNLIQRLLDIKGNIVDISKNPEYPDNFIGKLLVCIRENIKKYKRLTIASWNVNGIRTNILRPGSIKKCPKEDVGIENNSNLRKLIEMTNPEIICFQETRCGKDTGDCISVKEYPYRYWNCSKKSGARGSGYSGTAIWTKIKPVNVQYSLPTLPEEDQEGRIIIAEFPKFTLVNVYVPNSLSNEEYRLQTWDPSLFDYLRQLKLEGKRVIICGDFNVAHTENDVWFRKTNQRIAGVLPEEKAGMTKLLTEYTDVFRRFYPIVDNMYTWWSMRNKLSKELNKGWRLDYFLITPNLENNILTTNIWKNIDGSDHAPITITLRFKNISN